MKKKVIVTGGLGFIGSNLIELLLKKSYQVINIDKNSYSSNFYNVKEFKNNKNYSFIKCDIASPTMTENKTATNSNADILIIPYNN